MTQIRCLSYGGGIQSTALLLLAARREIDCPLILFSNVGNDSENPSTLAYVREHARPFAEQHGLEFVELTRRPTGTDETLLQRIERENSSSLTIPVFVGATGRPNKRVCTQDFKIRRIVYHLRKRGADFDHPAIVMLGISTDEYQRMRTDSGFYWTRNTYPLIETFNMSRDDCVELIANSELPVPDRSACWFCPFHTISYWQSLQTDHPALFAKAAELEVTLTERHRRMTGKDSGVFLNRRRAPMYAAFADALEPDTDTACDIAGYCHA